MREIGTVDKTRKTIKDYDFKIKKKFGQNFLIDKNILGNIIRQIGENKDASIIEVGPGFGGLTELALNKFKHVLSYEIDKEMIPILSENFKDYKNFTLVNEDILKVDLNTDINKYFNENDEIIFMSNLPYYITTPILMKVLLETKRVKRMVCLMQLEVAERICSAKNSKDYNALSIAIQYNGKARIAFKVPNKVFIPAPDVTSALVVIDIFNEKRLNLEQEKIFYDIIRTAFAQRRKTLMNNLVNGGYEKNKILDAFKKIGINEMARPENLSCDEFIDLSLELGAVK